MLSLGTNTGTGSVSVCVDDLSEEERKLVRATIQHIQNMHEMGKLSHYGAFWGFAISSLITFIMIRHTLDVNYVVLMSIFAVVTAFSGFVGWYIVSAIINQSHKKAIILIACLATNSVRCNDLVREYSEANPWFKQLLADPSTQAVTE